MLPKQLTRLLCSSFIRSYKKKCFLFTIKLPFWSASKVLPKAKGCADVACTQNRIVTLVKIYVNVDIHSSYNYLLTYCSINMGEQCQIVLKVERTTLVTIYKISNAPNSMNMHIIVVSIVRQIWCDVFCKLNYTYDVKTVHLKLSQPEI